MLRQDRRAVGYTCAIQMLVQETEEALVASLLEKLSWCIGAGGHGGRC